MGDSDMADVFISYSSSERALAAALAADIAALGYSAWWDHEIVGGSNFRTEIHRELTAARAVVVLWTPASVQSRWVQEEADEALHAGKLVPVRLPELDARQIPLGLRSVQALMRGDGEGLRKALERVCREPASQGATASSRRLRGYSVAIDRRTAPGVSPRCEQATVERWPDEQMLRSASALGMDLRNEVLAVVVDGRAFSGTSSGDELARRTAAGFIDGFTSETSIFGSPRPGCLVHGVWKANAAVGDEIARHPEQAGRCCPFVAAYLYDRDLSWASAGDCALLLWHNGVLSRLNQNHSMGALLDEQAAAGKISAAEARSARNREAQLSGLTGGKIPILDNPDSPLQIETGDWLILATQGLEALSGDEIARSIGAHRNGRPEALARALLDAIDDKRHRHGNNVAIVALRADPAT